MLDRPSSTFTGSYLKTLNSYQKTVNYKIKDLDFIYTSNQKLSKLNFFSILEKRLNSASFPQKQLKCAFIYLLGKQKHDVQLYSLNNIYFN